MSRNFAEGPTGREPGVLVQELAAMSALMFIDLGTTSHMALRLFHSELELLRPLGTVSVHVFVQLLQPREHCTRR